jgi:predicted transcriptional regulator
VSVGDLPVFRRVTKVFVDIDEELRILAQMTRRPRPTDAELAVLQVLWERGPSTVREVHQTLAPARETGQTTTLKIMQIMTEKGLVRRDESARTHVYSARLPREQTQRQLVSDLANRAFGGSAAALAMQALSAQAPSAEERREIRRLITEFGGRACGTRHNR